MSQCLSFPTTPRTQGGSGGHDSFCRISLGGFFETQCQNRFKAIISAKCASNFFGEIFGFNHDKKLKLNLVELS